MCLASLPKGFNHSRKNGDHNNDNNDERKVLFNDRYVSKEKTQQGHSNNPKCTSHNIIEQKPRISHSANTGHKRGKGTNDWNKPCQNNSFSPILFIELMSPV